MVDFPFLPFLIHFRFSHSRPTAVTQFAVLYRFSGVFGICLCIQAFVASAVYRLHLRHRLSTTAVLTSVVMGKGDSSKRPAHKKIRKPAAPPVDQMARTSERIAKKISRAQLALLFTPRSRSRVTSAASSRNTSRARKAKVTIDVSNELANDSNEDFFSSAADDAENEPMKNVSELPKKREVALQKRRLKAKKEALAVAEELRKLDVANGRFLPFISAISTFSVQVASAKQVMNYFNDSRFVAISADYPLVTSRMIADIQHRRINPKDIPRFIADFSAAESRNASKVKNLLQLLKSFKAFCMFVCVATTFFIQMPLALTMCFYRERLVAMFAVWIFDSIANYHHEYVCRAIRIGLNDSEVWRQNHKA